MKKIKKEDSYTPALSQFEMSLNALTGDDLSNSRPSKSKKISKVINIIVYTVLISIICYCVVLLIQKQFSYYRSNKVYDEIRNIFNSDGIEENLMKESSQNAPDIKLSLLISGDADYDIVDVGLDDISKMKIKIERIRNINYHAFGWIKILGTRVDYPLVQGPDNDYYLHRAFDGSYEFAGSIYIDSNNSKDITKNRNTVIYGHNMQDGTMFRTLLNFRDKPMFDDGIVEIYTLDGIYYYEVFSIHKAKDTFFYFKTDFETDEEFLEFCNTMHGLSMYYKDVKFDKDSKILTLSTCTNVNDDERYAVHAILIDKPKDK